MLREGCKLKEVAHVDQAAGTQLMADLRVDEAVYQLGGRVRDQDRCPTGKDNRQQVGTLLQCLVVVLFFASFGI
jgi:hypothetical protein